MIKLRHRQYPAWTATVLLLGFLVAFGAPLIFGGRSLAGGDIVNQYLPYKQLVREMLFSGQFPHWNPMTFGGRPLQADIQIGLFYPPNLLFWILPLEVAFDWSALLHFAIAFVGMIFWMRRRLHSAASLCLAGGLYAFAGWSASRFQSGIVLFPQTIAWIPWMLAAWDALTDPDGEESRRPYWFAALAGFSALTILAGAPQIAFYGFVILGVYVLLTVRYLGSDPDSSGDAADAETTPGLIDKGRLLGVSIAALALAVAICAVQILPTAGMIAQSWDRAQGAQWDYIVDGSLRPRLLLAYVAPFFFGDPLDEALYWGDATGYFETVAYMGIVPLFLAILFLCERFIPARDRHRNGDARRFEMLSIVLLICAAIFALGKHSPLFWLGYHIIPGFDRFRVPARMTLFFVLATAALSGWVLDRWIRQSETNAKSSLSRIIPVAILSSTALFALWLTSIPILHYMNMPFYRPDPAARATAIPLIPILEATARRSILGALVQSIVFAIFAILLVNGRKNGILRIFGAWGIVALALGILLPYGQHFQVSSPRSSFQNNFYPTTSRVDFLKQTLKPGERFVWFDSLMDWRFDQNQTELFANRTILHHFAGLRGYDPVNSRRLGLFTNAMMGLELDSNPKGFLFLPDNAPNQIAWDMLALWNCPVVLSYNDLSATKAVREIARWSFPGDPPGLLRAYRLNAETAPAFLRTPFVVPDNATPRSLAVLFTRHSFDPAKRAIIEGQPFDSPIPDDPAPSGSPGVVRILENNPGRITLETTVAKPSVLVLSQSYYPGWKAWVDGVQTHVLPTNLALCGIGVLPGEHHVEFVYQPFEFTQGVLISLVGLLFLAFFVLRWRNKLS
jgi:hypothetical protein